MNGDFLRYRGLLTVAVGAGVMIGAASVFIYNQFFGERRRLLLQNDINQLGVSVAEIRRELDFLRNVQLRHRQKGAQSIATDAETEMFSTVGGDDIDDEFYELSSDYDNIVEEVNTGTDDAYIEIDALLEGSSREDKTKGYGLLLELLEKDTENVEVLWRLAKACHMMGSVYSAEGNQDKKKEFVYKGTEYGEKALAANAGDWRAHKWYAVCVGARGQLQGVKERLRDGHTFKEHVDAAAAINPRDPTLHHLIGRFNFEVASLSWLERKVAGTLFGEVPQGSHSAAVVALMEAERLNPVPWKENRLLLAKCHEAQQDFERTIAWLDAAIQIPAVSAEDQLANKEIESLLKKYNSYRGLQT